MVCYSAKERLIRMSKLQTQVEQYLQDILDITPLTLPWQEEERLPIFLRDRYDFLEGKILDCPCIFMVDTDENEESPAVLGKHIEQIRSKFRGPVVFVRAHITSYNRKRLVEHRIPFIVPGNQMYLPPLGIDFREYFRQPRPIQDKLRPSSQAVLLHVLHEKLDSIGLTAMANKLGYTAMTMSRSFDELEAAELILPMASVRGKERNLVLAAARRDIWKKAQPLLQSPIKTSHSINLLDMHELPGPKSGLTALAHYSMLAEPRNINIALSKEDWKSLKQRGAVSKAFEGEPGVVIAEEWRYAPSFFASNGIVDRLSLYLSLRDLNDERVQSALDDMMEGMQW